MRVRFTGRAFADREAIFEYLQSKSPAGASKVMSRLRHAIGLLSSGTLSGHATDFGAIRVLFIGRYPYKVFFRATADVIEILAIRHTSRLPDLE